MIKIFSDEQVLDPIFRQRIIKEINEKENVDRKRRQAAKWEIYRDMIQPHVMALLKTQGFKPATLAVMEARCTDINIFKKIVDKKSRAYTKGVSRQVDDNEKATQDVEAVAQVLQMSTNMKRIDRYRHAARNCVGYLYPEQIEVRNEDGTKTQKYTLCLRPLFPHLYDVIPDASDHERPRCFILSPFSDNAAIEGQPAITGDGRNFSQPLYQRDGREQIIANSPRDTGSQKRNYVWWTATHHFTTDDKGNIIPSLSPEDRLNPIKELPIVNFSTDQDGEFWAQGGDDLVNGTKLVNLKLTDMESILHMQGWGQLCITGQNLGKQEFAVGPQTALMLETGKDAEVPTDAKILASDPHTDSHLKSTEVYVALLLTTNNLSVKSVATNLEASSLASAIAKMVDEAEVMDDVSDDQEYYAGKEKEIFHKASLWIEAYKPSQTLITKLQDVAPIPADSIHVKYNNVEQVVTEADKLANLKIRKELGIDTMVDLVKRDNPQMTDAEAEEKLKKIMEEKQKLSPEADPKPDPAETDPLVPEPGEA